MARDDHVRTVGANRRAWALLNAGFGFATVLTATGLWILAAAEDPGQRHARRALISRGWHTRSAVLSGWPCSPFGRGPRQPWPTSTRAASDPEPAETLVGSATSGLFNGFVVLTSAALVVLGGHLGSPGASRSRSPASSASVGLGCLGWLAVAGDVIPAVLYLPTLVLGISLLAG